MLYGFIYITTNKINNKKYIGKKKMGTKDAMTYLGSGKRLLKAIGKYGIENFERDIIDYAVDIDNLNSLEKYYIELYNAQESDDFYNISSGGDWGDITQGMTEEEFSQYRRKLSIAVKKSYESNPSLRVLRSIDQKGKVVSKETREKLSEVNKGKIISKEVINKALATKKLRRSMGIVYKNPWDTHTHPMLGKKHSDETKKKIADKNRELFKGENNPMYGKSHTEYSKEKMRQYRLNNPMSKELIDKLRARYSVEYIGENNPNYGNFWTDEQKKRLSEKQKEGGKYKGENNPMYGKKGENALNGQRVYMMDDNKNIIKSFTTVGKTLEYLGIKGHSALNKACRSGKKYRGYYWTKEWSKGSK